MRLLAHDSNGQLYVTGDLAEHDVKPYAILSHTWGQAEEEVGFREIGLSTSRTRPGYTKIEFCGQQARKDGWEYFWVDTCCIDKTSSTELSKAVTLMYQWYKQAQVCYVYLADVSSRPVKEKPSTERTWESGFRLSRWFKRGWTLQELLAPQDVVFYSKQWDRLGTKHELKDLIHDITGIPIPALEGQPLSRFPVIERMRWIQGRKTKEKEDQAYCLLGIFGVYMSLNYGEGDNAFRRLQKKLDTQPRDGNDIHLCSRSIASPINTEPLGMCLNAAPYIQPELFIGRTDEIQSIHNILCPDNASHKRQKRVVLGGLGGVGKTQIAVAYAHEYENSYTSVIWLNATSKQTLYTGFKSIAEQLINPLELEKLDQEQMLRRVRSWLSCSINTRWLLIFDNYDDPGQYNLADFYPNTKNGSIIITTRLPEKVDGYRVQVLPLTAIDDSLSILQSRSGREGVMQDIGARALAKRLGGLPIALVTAGAYLHHSNITFHDYLDTYEQSWHVGRKPVSVREYQDRTLYSTWNLTYSLLEVEDPEAAQMLKLLAYFDHQELWYELFQAGVTRYTHFPAWLPASLINRVDFGDVMATLASYGLVDIHHVNQSYSMYSIHSCVHDWILGSLNIEIDVNLYWYALACVAGSFDKNDYASLAEVRFARVSRHATRLAHPRFGREDQCNFCCPECLSEAGSVAFMLLQQEEYNAAEKMFLRILTSEEKLFGVHHVSTLNTVNCLGVLYYRKMRLAEAERMYKRARAGREKVYPAGHPDILATMHNLGLLYFDQGKLVEAEQLCDQAKAGYEKAFGQEHQSTLDTLNNIGLLYLNQGKLREAEKTFELAITGYKKVLRKDHVMTIGTLRNLGNLYLDEGNLVKAEPVLLEVLTAHEKLLGANHTSTLHTVHSLGKLYLRQGKLVEAEQNFKRALAGFTVALGVHDKATLDQLWMLGDVYNAQEQFAGAEVMYERALTGYTETLAVDHMSALNGAYNLGCFYHDQGRFADAGRLYDRALAGYLEALGPDHKYTLDAMLNISCIRYAQGILDEAHHLLRCVLTGRQKTLGDNDPATKDVLKRLEKVKLDMTSKVE